MTKHTASRAKQGEAGRQGYAFLGRQCEADRQAKRGRLAGRARQEGMQGEAVMQARPGRHSEESR